MAKKLDPKKPDYAEGDEIDQSAYDVDPYAQAPVNKNTLGDQISDTKTAEAIEPTSSPIDLVAGGVGSKIGSIAAREIIEGLPAANNEIGSIGKNLMHTRNEMVAGEALPGRTPYTSPYAAGAEDPTNMPNLPWGEREIATPPSSGIKVSSDIKDLTGQGTEYLVHPNDPDTIIAKFQDGNMVGASNQSGPVGNTDPTLIPGKAVGGVISDTTGSLPIDTQSYADGGQAPLPTPVPSGQQPAAAPMFDDLPDDNSAASQGSFDSLVDDSDKYTSFGQQAGAAAEAGLRGLTGPIGPAVEAGISKLGFPNLSPQEQANRRQYNPDLAGITQGLSTVAGLALPVSQLGAISSVAGSLAGVNEVAQAGRAAKIAANAVKLGLEGGMLQGNDEITNAILGQGDPEHPVSAALSHMGASSLLSGGLGVVTGASGAGARMLAESKIGQAASKLMGDFGRQWEFIQGNLDPLSSSQSEVNGRIQEVDNLMNGGLKKPLIDKLTQDVTPDQLNQHVMDTAKTLRTVPKILADAPEFKAAVDSWNTSVTPRVDPITLQPLYTPAASDVFQATDRLKAVTQELSQYNKQVVHPSEYAWRNASMNVSSKLKDSLEDPSVWNKMGDAQAAINAAKAPMYDIQKEFLSKFASKEMGDKVADPAKLNTYLGQISRAQAGAKSSAGLKTNYVSNYLDQSNKLADVFNDLHTSNGIDAPYPSGLSSTPVLDNSLDPSPTSGAKMADWFANRGYPSLSGKIASKIAAKGVGAVGGNAIGGPLGGITGAASADEINEHLMPYFRNIIGDKINKYAVPAALRVLSSGETAGIPEALQHADNVAKGAYKMKKAVAGLFNSAAAPQQVTNSLVVARNRKKLDDLISSGELNKQIQQAATPSPAPNVEPTPSATQNFAEGGEVHAVPAQETPSLPAPTPPAATSISTHFPTQAMMLSSAKGRISNYLNSIRPQNNIKLPYDGKPNDKEQQRGYEKALDIANEPLSVLNNIKQGNITPEHLKHFVSMYPEVHNQLSKQINKKIGEDQLKGQKPPYHVIQGLSMFLGAPLDSTMTPAAIQAAQPKPQQAQPQTPTQPANKPKRSMNSLNKLPNQYQTADQSAEADRAGRKS